MRLGATDLWTPDEPRYAQVAEEMRSMQHGPSGLVLLHLNDEVYTQKPPLYYWLAAAVGAPFGRVTEWAARLPSALAGLGLVTLVMVFGSRLLGGASGTLGAALLLTTYEFSRYARRVQLDALLALAETAALFAFWRLDRGLGRRAPNQILLHAALGLAVLTKGPVGFLVPILIMAAFLAWEGRLRDLRRAFPWWGPLLSLGPALLWLAAAVAVAPPDFFDDAVVENIFGRFFEGTSHQRPFYYYLYQFPLDFMPWILALPVVVWAARRRSFAAAESPERKRAWRFLLAWVATTLVFFSLSSGKRGVYMIPMFPAAALLCADALRDWVEGGHDTPRTFSIVVGAVAGVIAGFGIFVALSDPLHDPTVSLAFGVGAVAAVVGCLAVWLSFVRARAPRRYLLLVPVAMAYMVELGVFAVALPTYNPQKSVRAAAEIAAELTPPGQPIGLWRERSLIGGIRYYGGRPVAFFLSQEQVERFFDEGGSVLLLAEKNLDALRSARPVEVRLDAGEGRRDLVVVTPQRVTP